VHLDSVYADCGQTVGRGEVIGTVGQTGSSSFPHLHFEVRRSGFNFNPLDWLP
jgi:murein DD-endopeptidase MepM/ murein hydrolase activator NlpD